MFFYFLLSFLVIFIYKAFAMFLEVSIYDDFYFIFNYFYKSFVLPAIYFQLFYIL